MGLTERMTMSTASLTDARRDVMIACARRDAERHGKDHIADAATCPRSTRTDSRTVPWTIRRPYFRTGCSRTHGRIG